MATTVVCICGMTAEAHAPGATDHPYSPRTWGESKTWERAIHFDRRMAAFSSNVYVTLEDRLLITVINAAAGAELDIGVRLQLSDGQIIPMFNQISPASTRTVQTFVMALAEGMLLSVDASTPTAAVRRGQMFINLALARGTAAAPQFLFDLAEGYVVTGNDIGTGAGGSVLSVDGTGVPRAVQVGNPAAGADWTVPVPAGARWQVQALSAQLVDSAAVANRVPHLVITDGAAHTLWNAAASSNQIAGQTFVWSATPTMAASINDSAGLLPLPTPAVLLQGWTLATLTTGLQAGDQWQNIWLSVLEWMEP